MTYRTLRLRCEFFGEVYAFEIRLPLAMYWVKSLAVSHISMDISS